MEKHESYFHLYLNYKIRVSIFFLVRYKSRTFYENLGKKSYCEFNMGNNPLVFFSIVGIHNQKGLTKHKTMQ